MQDAFDDLKIFKREENLDRFCLFYADSVNDGKKFVNCLEVYMAFYKLTDDKIEAYTNKEKEAGFVEGEEEGKTKILPNEKMREFFKMF